MKIEIEISNNNIKDYENLLKRKEWKNRGFKMTLNDIFNEIIVNYAINDFWGKVGCSMVDISSIELLQNKSKNVAIINKNILIEIDKDTFEKLKVLKVR